jgi:hypothetical protein
MHARSYVGRGNVEVYRPRGAFRDLWTATDPELLLDGPAGTGKTRGILERVVHLTDTVPGLRWGIFRRTRASLNETVLETLENKVLAPVRHPMLTARNRAHRDKYVNPRTGAQIILGGFDSVEKLFSMELDGAYVAEAIETTQSQVTSLWRAMRNGAWDRHQLIMDTNPGPWKHWLNQRCTDVSPERGRTRRLRTYHRDNPTLTREFLRNLDEGLQDEMRDRLFLGLWVSPEGLIITTFGPHNVLTGEVQLGELALQQVGGRWVLVLPEYAPIGTVTEDGEQRHVLIRWFGAAVDWGPEAPGAIQLWGVTEDDRHILLEEIYETAMPLERYADVVCEWHDKYRLARVICDSADPDKIRMVNERLRRVDRAASGLATKAPKSVHVGIDTMRWFFDLDEQKIPRAFLLDNALRRADEQLLRAAAGGKPRPLCLRDELEALVWEKHDEDEREKERIDKHCADHAFDAARYWMRWAYMQRFGPTTPTQRFTKGTMGALFKHDEVIR